MTRSGAGDRRRWLDDGLHTFFLAMTLVAWVMALLILHPVAWVAAAVLAVLTVVLQVRVWLRAVDQVMVEHDPEAE